MISFQHVSKDYGGKMAINDLNLDIHDGEIFGLIGHNGAGKSTTIKMLVSVISPSAGKIKINGLDLSTHRDEIKTIIGYVPDSPDMFLKLTAMAYWRFIATIFKMQEELAFSRIESLCQSFELGDVRYDVIENFSHGMRQKVFVIGALLSDPALWVLDEPLTGLDPQSAYNLKEMMRQHAASGKTVLFSTHVLPIVQELCDRIGILRHGQLIFCGTMEELRQTHSGENLEDIYLRLISGVKENGA